jgi:hypothetical protein
MWWILFQVNRPFPSSSLFQESLVSLVSRTKPLRIENPMMLVSEMRSIRVPPGLEDGSMMTAWRRHIRNDETVQVLKTDVIWILP